MANFSSCPYGSAFINPLTGENTFNYQLDPNYQPLLSSFSWNGSGPVSVKTKQFLALNQLIFSQKTCYFCEQPQFLIKIYTDNIISTSGPDVNMNQLVDYYVIDFNTNKSYIPSVGSSNILYWQAYPMVSGYLNGNNTR